ncbi:MAG: TetR/AcrR family transcriptional regulator [Firmicutes bacterium]|nr:TetR/AcrR family transcriptional regulator [Bacillota bacterium]
MNEKFFRLPEEKLQRIINGGFRVFSGSPYRKCSMQEIADAAGISKSLLFFYFRNKKELYLFLWEKASEITERYLEEHRCRETDDLFEMMERGMVAKIRIMEQYPHVAQFAIRAFYEKDEAVRPEVQRNYRKKVTAGASGTLARLDPEDFRPGLDLEMMCREMYWASEGYLWEMTQGDRVDRCRMEQDFCRLIQFWKSIYRKKE